MTYLIFLFLTDFQCSKSLVVEYSLKLIFIPSQDVYFSSLGALVPFCLPIISSNGPHGSLFFRRWCLLVFYWKCHLLRAEFLSGSCGKTFLEVLPHPGWLRFIFPQVSVCFSSCHSEKRDVTYSVHPDFSLPSQCRMNFLLRLAVPNVGSAPPPLTSGPSSMQTQGVHSFLHGLYFYLKKKKTSMLYW